MLVSKATKVALTSLHDGRPAEYSCWAEGFVRNEEVRRPCSVVVSLGPLGDELSDIASDHDGRPWTVGDKFKANRPRPGRQ